jgi:hypothetical protein
MTKIVILPYFPYKNLTKFCSRNFILGQIGCVQWQRRVTDGILFSAQIMFFSYKKSLNEKISNNFFSFFSTRNQNFPHIPYVASKKSSPYKIKSCLSTNGTLYWVKMDMHGFWLATASWVYNHLTWYIKWSFLRPSTARISYLTKLCSKEMLCEGTP